MVLFWSCDYSNWERAKENTFFSFLFTALKCLCHLPSERFILPHSVSTPFLASQSEAPVIFFLTTLSHCVISKTSFEVKPWQSTSSFRCVAHWLWAYDLLPLPTLNSSLWCFLFPAQKPVLKLTIRVQSSLSLCFLKVFWELHYTSCHAGLCKREGTTEGHPPSLLGSSVVP